MVLTWEEIIGDPWEDILTQQDYETEIISDQTPEIDADELEQEYGWILHEPQNNSH